MSCSETTNVIPLQHGYYLSPYAEGDQEALAYHLQDPDAHKGLLLLPNPYTLENANFWVQLRLKEAKTPETFFAVRRPDGYLIGSIGATYDGSKHKCEFGYWISADYRGRGIMPVVLQRYATYLFNQFHSLKRLQATIFWYNNSSGKALLKAGFTEEGGGRLRAYYHKNGEYIDAISYSLLSDDPLPPIEMKP